MHPEADAFLDAIFDHPDDDTVRLVYADWLEEHDQGNYAQFIRLQCAAAREKLWSDEANRLWEEIGRVWTRLDAEWWPATRDVWGDEYSDGVLLDAIHFERGLLRIHVTITLSTSNVTRTVGLGYRVAKFGCRTSTILNGSRVCQSHEG